MLTGLASTPRPPVPGALDDDPLTSPSFSLREAPATDSRSYGHARKSGQTGTGPLASNGAGHTAGRDNGGYSAGPDPAADYAGLGYAHPAEPAAAAQWYAAPPAEPAATPAYANPYSYPSPATGSSAGDAGHGSYLADPLRVYSPPPYEPTVSAYPDPSGPSYQAAPPMELPGHDPYPGAYPEQPYAPGHAQPEPAQYQDGYTGGGYTPGYENGYGGDPYTGGGFGTYQP